MTPRSVWIAGDLSMDRVHEALASFGDSPVIVKDFEKSRNHEWLEACFVPSASDRLAAERVVRRFLELQGDDLEGGLVFRQLISFRPIGTHLRSDLTLSEEYRIFWLDGSPVFWSPYWPEGSYPTTRPPIEQFARVAAKVESRFFAMDLAERSDGEWLIMEIGDAQVTGLPRVGDSEQFYETLRQQRPD